MIRNVSVWRTPPLANSCCHVQVAVACQDCGSEGRSWSRRRVSRCSSVSLRCSYPIRIIQAARCRPAASRIRSGRRRARSRPIDGRDASSPAAWANGRAGARRGRCAEKCDLPAAAPTTASNETSHGATCPRSSTTKIPSDWSLRLPIIAKAARALPRSAVRPRVAAVPRHSLARPAATHDDYEIL
jgi:hypothetical protein